jgi:predicted dinucleotide-binding enzyme
MAKNVAVRSSRRSFFHFAGAAALLALGPLRPLAAARRKPVPLNIGTIGSGHIGGTLGGLWVRAGHPVMFSSRHPQELKGLIEGLGPLAQAGTVQEAIAFGDAVLLAVPYGALPQLGKDYAAALAAKRLVLDACNPFPARDGEIATWAREKGAGLATAQLLPGARLVRAFNAIGYARLADAGRRQGERVGMPIAGDDREALALAAQLVREIGFEPVVIGSLAMGRYLLPGTPLAGEHTAEEIRRIAATLR